MSRLFSIILIIILSLSASGQELDTKKGKFSIGGTIAIIPPSTTKYLPVRKNLWRYIAGPEVKISVSDKISFITGLHYFRHRHVEEGILQRFDQGQLVETGSYTEKFVVGFLQMPLKLGFTYLQKDKTRLFFSIGPGIEKELFWKKTILENTFYPERIGEVEKEYTPLQEGWGILFYLTTGISYEFRQNFEIGIEGFTYVRFFDNFNGWGASNNPIGMANMGLSLNFYY